MTKEKRIAPSDRELDVLKVFWEIGEASVRDVHKVMSPNGEFAVTTIQTLIRIMADKGLLSVRRDNRTLHYTSLYTPEQAGSRFLHKLFDGAVDQLVLNMIRAEDLSDNDLAKLERLIVESRKAKRKGRKP
ncbi:MAG: BlaI/MecI/CopY family transcriptional regulator [Planctomycetaceae bacterium]|nr:BlaI/MecI/CopY family transcriptional regulator [Planctomycetaceae bacterium]